MTEFPKSTNVGLKGQSGLEYLVTYGWMLIAVSVAGATIYNNLDESCRLEAQSSFGPFPKVADVGKTTGGNIAVELRNPQDDYVYVEDLKFRDNGSLVSSVDINSGINGESSSGYTASNLRPSEECNTFEAEIVYGSEEASELSSTATIVGEVEIVKILAEFKATPSIQEPGKEVKFNASDSNSSKGLTDYQWEFSTGENSSGRVVNYTFNQGGVYVAELTVTDEEGNTASESKKVFIGGFGLRSGGEFPKLGISDTLAARCIGNNCTNSSSSDNTIVEVSGGRIEGTVLTDEISMISEEICLTSKNSFDRTEGCSKFRSGPDDPLTRFNYNMSGSLNATVIKPFESESICVGSDCG